MLIRIIPSLVWAAMCGVPTKLSMAKAGNLPSLECGSMDGGWGILGRKLLLRLLTISFINTHPVCQVKKVVRTPMRADSGFPNGCPEAVGGGKVLGRHRLLGVPARGGPKRPAIHRQDGRTVDCGRTRPIPLQVSDDPSLFIELLLIDRQLYRGASVRG